MRYMRFWNRTNKRTNRVMIIKTNITAVKSFSIRLINYTVFIRIKRMKTQHII